jgi:flagellar biosynthesis protein FlhA
VRRLLLLATLVALLVPAASTAQQPGPLLQPTGPLPAHGIKLSARAAILVDGSTGKVLWGRYIHRRLHIASTTKILTALVAMDRLGPHSIVKVDPAVRRVPPIVEGLRPNERVQAWKLLYGLLLYSGNDDALALAVGAGGTRSRFVALMNEKARELGLTETHFARPDGLVSQIPALLVSTAAGIVVTKGGMEGTADAALMRQLGGSPKPLAMAAGAAAVLALMPGLPMLPFMALAGLAGGGAGLRRSNPPRPEGEVQAGAPVAAEPPITEALRIDLVRIELGYGLLALAGGEAPRLTEQIKGLRRAVATEMGFVLPPVRIQDNMQLEPDAYCVRIKEIEAGRGTIRPNLLLAMDPDGRAPDLAGEATREPTFNLPALWIDPALRDEANFRGCTVVDPPSVLTTHLTEIVKQTMADLLSYAETQKLLDELPREQQKLVAELIPSQISAGGVQRVLQSLLSERVSIRDLPTILEGIQEACGGQARAIPAITAHVRTRLARQISDANTGPNGYLPLITLSPEWETIFAESLVGPPEERQLAMPPSRLGEFMQRLRTAFDDAAATGEAPALLTGGNVRFHVRAIVERIRPETPVLAQAEIHPRARIRTVGSI